TIVVRLPPPPAGHTPRRGTSASDGEARRRGRGPRADLAVAEAALRRGSSPGAARAARARWKDPPPCPTFAPRSPALPPTTSTPPERLSHLRVSGFRSIRDLDLDL